MVDLKTLVRRHDAELRAFCRQLFSADSTAWVGSDAGTGQPPSLPRFGPVRSPVDRHADLTIVGDVVDQSVLMDAPGRSGTVVTLSVAAHHRMLGSRLPVDEADAVGWTRAVLGEEWASHAYSAGALSTTRTEHSARTPRLTTRFFYVFITRDGKPESVPVAFHIPVEPLT